MFLLITSLILNLGGNVIFTCMYVGKAICYKLCLYEWFPGRMSSQISRKRCLRSFFQDGDRRTREATPQSGVKLPPLPMSQK